MHGAAVTVTVLALLGGSANAQPVGGVEPAGPLVLAHNAVDVGLAIEASATRNSIARPLSFSPDLWWGATSRVTLGLVHSQSSLDRIDTGGTFCLRETPVGRSTCQQVYGGSAIDARWSLRDGPLAFAPRARLLLRDTDPWKPAIALGVTARAAAGRFAITSDPYLRLGLANRDLGNRAHLVVPLFFAVQPAAATLITVQLGYDSDLAVARDGYRIPVGASVKRALGRDLEVDVAFGWPALLGAQHELRRRVIALTVTWHARGA